MRRGDALSRSRPSLLRRYLVAVQAVRDDLLSSGSTDEEAVRSVVSSVHRALAAALGAPADLPAGRLRGSPVTVPDPPGSLLSPQLLGQVYERLIDPAERRGRGAHYTPTSVAALAVDAAAAAAERPLSGARVSDPTVGCGAFLLAAATALSEAGVPPEEVVEERLFGADLDPLAIDVAAASLSLWSRRPYDPDGRLFVADALHVDASAWTAAPADGFDLVVGNPPFLSQLSAATARDDHCREAARRRFGAAAGRYADTAALFVLVALRMARPGGAVALLQPESFLAAVDLTAVRQEVLAAASLREVWLAGELFEAAVRVCVPVLRAGPVTGTREAVAVTAGPHRAPVGAVEGRELSPATWGAVAASALGVPAVHVRSSGTLGDWCSATADFRHAYYAIVPLVREAAAEGDVPVVTSGLIDPAALLWGARAARIGKRTWQAPAVAASHLEGDEWLRRWSGNRLVPKAVLAAQTPVIEAVVDPTGRLLPLTPVITVECLPERLWHLAAVLLSPVASALALRWAGGAGMSAGAIRLPARRVLDLPTPSEPTAWDAAAGLVREASGACTPGARRSLLVEAASASCASFGVEHADSLVDWWGGRLPDRDAALGATSSA